MPRYRFQWNAFPQARLRGLCRDLALDTADPARSLRLAYGARPDSLFVQQAWPFLRDRLLAADRPLRQKVVQDLVALGVGTAPSHPGRTAELDFLRARNTTVRLREVVLNAILDAGARDGGTGAATSPDGQQGKESGTISSSGDRPEAQRSAEAWARWPTGAARFRLPGFGGAALLFRSHIVPGRALEEKDDQLVVDVGLLSPHRLVQYFSRPVGDDFVDGLARHFFQFASDVFPEQSAPTFADPVLGFTLSAMQSTDHDVEIEVTVLEHPGEDVQDPDGINFKTTRAAMVTAAHDVRILDGSSGMSALDGDL